MKSNALAPVLHLFVCANRREAGSPLGPGCGDSGEQVFAAMKDEVMRRAAYRAIWVTQTRCLGICPKQGATVAIYPRQAIVSEVEPADVAELFEEAWVAARAAGAARG